MIEQFVQDISASKQTSKILTGELAAVELIKKNQATEEGVKEVKVPCGIIFYGEYKVFIPASEMNIIRDDIKEVFTIMKTMVGSVVDFIVTDIVDDSKAVASRKKAMNLRISLELPKHKAGNIVPVRIVGIGRTTAYVEVYGKEVRIPKEEVDWGYISDLRDVIQVGDIKRALIQTIDLESNELKVSIKRAVEDPYIKNIKKVTKNSLYEATVTGIMSYGIFLELKYLKGIRVLCPYPHWHSFNPEQGDIYVIKIKSIDAASRNLAASFVREVRKLR